MAPTLGLGSEHPALQLVSGMGRLALIFWGSQGLGDLWLGVLSLLSLPNMNSINFNTLQLTEVCNMLAGTREIRGWGSAWTHIFRFPDCSGEGHNEGP